MQVSTIITAGGPVDTLDGRISCSGRPIPQQLSIASLHSPASPFPHDLLWSLLNFFLISKYSFSIIFVFSCNLLTSAVRRRALFLHPRYDVSFEFRVTSLDKVIGLFARRGLHPQTSLLPPPPPSFPLSEISMLSFIPP